MNAKPTQIRCLSVKWPWCLFILFGGKDVENRLRRLIKPENTPPGGLELAIHCGLVADLSYSENICYRAIQIAMEPEALEPNRHDLDLICGYNLWDLVVDQVNAAGLQMDKSTPVTPDRWVGKILGTVKLVDVTTNHPSPWAEPGAIHHVLAEPKPLKTPVPAPGNQGIFYIDRSILEVE